MYSFNSLFYDYIGICNFEQKSAISVRLFTDIDDYTFWELYTVKLAVSRDAANALYYTC